MNLLRLKLSYEILLLTILSMFCFVSCSQEDEPKIDKQEENFYHAGSVAKSITENWINSGSGARIAKTYNSDNLVALLDSASSKGIYTILNPDDSSETISFNILEDSSIANAMKTKVTLTDDGNILNEIYSLDDQLQISFIDYQDGTREMLSGVKESNGRITSSWGKRFDKCLGQMNSPFDSHFANYIFSGIANSATLGLYGPTTLVFCAGAGFGNQPALYCEYCVQPSRGLWDIDRGAPVLI